MAARSLLVVSVPSKNPAHWEMIKRTLEVRGLWNADGINRRAKARYCRSCPAVVIAGLDHDRSAVAAYLDPTPVNPLGEAMALLSGRRTYSLRWLVDHYELDLRWAEGITAHPAGSQPLVEILVSHECNSAPFPAHMYGAGITRPTDPFGDDLECPPF